MRPGTRLGKWEIRRPLGEGSFGSLYEVVRPVVPNRPRALKIVQYGSDASHEIQTLRALSHRRLTTIYESLSSRDGLPVGSVGIVMDLGDESFETALKVSGPVTAAAFRLVGLDVAAALHHLHHGRDTEFGAVHADLKAANIVRYGQIWKVADFGLTTNLSGTSATILRGYTPAYAAPEILRARRQERPLIATCATDIFSFGIVATRALLGATPPRLPDETVDVEAICQRTEPETHSLLRGCLSATPGNRVDSAALLGLVDECGPSPLQASPTDLVRQHRDVLLAARNSYGSEVFAGHVIRWTNQSTSDRFFAHALAELEHEEDRETLAALTFALHFATLMEPNLPGLFQPMVAHGRLEEVRHRLIAAGYR